MHWPMPDQRHDDVGISREKVWMKKCVQNFWYIDVYLAEQLTVANGSNGTFAPDRSSKQTELILHD